MHNVHKRQPKTVKLNQREERLVAKAARIKGMPPATFHRLYTVAAARRIVREHTRLRKQTAASSVTS